MRRDLRAGLHGVAVASLDEAVELANATRYGLQAGIFTPSLKTPSAAAPELEFGGVAVNEAPTFRCRPDALRRRQGLGQHAEGPACSVREMTEDRLVVVQLP